MDKRVGSWLTRVGTETRQYFLPGRSCCYKTFTDLVGDLLDTLKPLERSYPNLRN